MNFKATRRLLVALCLACWAAAAERPQRIVSLSPDLTEILYGVGAFARVVGVSNYDTYPAETAKLPRLGPLQSPSLEKLAALHADLVVINSAQAPFIEDSLEKLGVRILKISNQSIDEVYKAMISIGQATGNVEGASRLAAATRDGLRRTASRTAGLTRPSVALVIDRTPGTLRDLYTATGGSYLAELVEIAGGRMALPAAPRGYRKLDKEELLAADPEIVLDFVPAIGAWGEMPELRAVRTHRIYEVKEDFAPHASQRIAETAELFAKLIHPEKH